MSWNLMSADGILGNPDESHNISTDGESERGKVLYEIS